MSSRVVRVPRGGLADSEARAALGLGLAEFTRLTGWLVAGEWFFSGSRLHVGPDGVRALAGLAGLAVEVVAESGRVDSVTLGDGGADL